MGGAERERKTEEGEGGGRGKTESQEGHALPAQRPMRGLNP